MPVIGQPTRLENIIAPPVWDKYFQPRFDKANPFMESGICSRGIFRQMAPHTGIYVDMPYWNDIGGDPSIPDDSNNDLPFDGIDTGQDAAVLCAFNKGWSNMAITNVFSGSSAEQAIVARVTPYWQRWVNEQIARQSRGILAACIERDSDGNPVYRDLSGAIVAPDAPGASATPLIKNFATNDHTAITEANMLDENKLIDVCIDVYGERYGEIRGMCLHPRIYGNLKKRMYENTKGWSFKVYGEGQSEFMVFENKFIFMSQKMRRQPILVGDVPTGRYIYDTQLFGPGALAFDWLPVDNGEPPAEWERKAMAGNASVRYNYATRVKYGLHVRGVAWVAARQKRYPTLAELQNPASWALQFPMDEIRTLIVQTNG